MNAVRAAGVHYAFIPDWNEVPLVKKIGPKLGVPVILQNNLRAIHLKLTIDPPGADPA